MGEKEKEKIAALRKTEEEARMKTEQNNKRLKKQENDQKKALEAKDAAIQDSTNRLNEQIKKAKALEEQADKNLAAKEAAEEAAAKAEGKIQKINQANEIISGKQKDFDDKKGSLIKKKDERERLKADEEKLKKGHLSDLQKTKTDKEYEAKTIQEEVKENIAAIKENYTKQIDTLNKDIGKIEKNYDDKIKVVERDISKIGE